MKHDEKADALLSDVLGQHAWLNLEEAGKNAYRNIVARHTPAPAFRRGTDPKGNECFYWSNPYNGEDELVAMLFWPTHPVEATKAVEELYESLELRAKVATEDSTGNPAPKTEAGNDMTARESFFERHIRRLAQGYRQNAEQSVSHRDDRWLRDVAGELEAVLSEAPTPANVMSSPKSGSVPAVAGGGEDGAMLDWLFSAGAVYAWQRGLERKVHFAWHGDSDQRRPDFRQAIRAAIAATKAKEDGK